MTALPAITEWPAAVGVRPGNSIQLMADVTRLAWAYRKSGGRFDAGRFLSAFVEAVGPDGNVLVPTYNFDLRSGDHFDVRRTRSISGAMANAALDHPAFVRTQHPLHSFAIAGADAARLATIDHRGSFDESSPFAFLKEHNATLVAIDLPLNDAFTFVHFVEQQEQVHYRRHQRCTIRYTGRDGQAADRQYELFAKKSGYVNSFERAQGPLIQAGAFSEQVIAGSRVLRIDLSKGYDVIKADIHQNNARSIHHFDAKVWLADVLKGVLHTFGLRTAKERLAHAARTR